MELFIFSYVIQIALGIYGFTQMQVRTGFDEKLRRVVLNGAWMPCMFLSVFYQVGAIALYHLRGAHVARKEAAAGARLQSSFDLPSRSQTRPPASTADNPFSAGETNPPPEPSPGDNPFG